MQLLSENELTWSPVVANSSMNRERNSSGINSYEKECKFSPEQFLTAYIKLQGSVKWLDICCGQGKALIQTAAYLAENNLQDKATLTGIDIIDAFLSIPLNIQCLSFKISSAVKWVPTERYDLITCVHGLHYIGDKLKVMGQAMGALNPGGLFIANLDLQNIQIAGVNTGQYLKDFFRKNKVSYHARRRIISCKGPQNVPFNLQYEGASDKAGPNYTGQEAVNSYYKLLR